MKSIHQRMYPATQKKAKAVLDSINKNRQTIGHKEMTMPELFDFLVEFYKENNDDNNNR